jgi:hypothetical protein
MEMLTFDALLQITQDRRNEEASIFITLLIEAVRASETCVYFNETTRSYIPDDYLFDKISSVVRVMN